MKRPITIPDNARLKKDNIVSTATTVSEAAVETDPIVSIPVSDKPETVKKKEAQDSETTTIQKKLTDQKVVPEKSQTNMYLSLEVLSVVDDLEYELRKKGVKTNRSLLTEEALNLLFDKYRKKGFLKA